MIRYKDKNNRKINMEDYKKLSYEELRMYVILCTLLTTQNGTFEKE